MDLAQFNTKIQTALGRKCSVAKCQDLFKAGAGVDLSLDNPQYSSSLDILAALSAQCALKENGGRLPEDFVNKRITKPFITARAQKFRDLQAPHQPTDVWDPVRRFVNRMEATVNDTVKKSSAQR